MADSEVQLTATPVVPIAAMPADQSATNSYPMSRDGRRQAYILLIGVASIEIFAIWTLVTLLDGGLDGAEWVSAALMLAIALVAPLVGWALLEEANCRVTLTGEGLRYTTLGGVDLFYPWNSLASFKTKGQRGRIARFFLGDEAENKEENSAAGVQSTEAASDDTDDDYVEADPEPVSLVVRDSYREESLRNLANPVVRFLHNQAHGATVPLYGGLENRDQLLQRIASQIESE